MKAKNQQIWIVVFACLVIALYVASKLFPLPWSDSSSNAAFNEAVATCEKGTRTHFGSRLGDLKFDKSSSRYDKTTERYRIFFYAQVNVPRSVDLYVLCAVDAENGKLVQLDAVEQSSAADKNANKFGWPAR
jgi:hypothetical protein